MEVLLLEFPRGCKEHDCFWCGLCRGNWIGAARRARAGRGPSAGDLTAARERLQG